MTKRSPAGSPRLTKPLGALTIGALVVGGGVIAATPAAAATPLTITPNPRYANTEFEGWGTSLVWFANATGGYPEELREELYQAVFGEEGLDLNIARYNIGGQNATDVVDYLRPGGAVDGWWAEDADGSAGTYGGAATDYASRAAVRAAFDAGNVLQYDVDADATQRWWIDRLVEDDQITHWEAFANSAPYFMTESGYVSGGFNSSAEQLRPDSVESFARYLVTVTGLLEDAHGIEFDTIDPLNEPNTNYWGTTLSGGVPVGGRQEGMHVGPAMQADLIDALADVLAERDTVTDAVISAPDETNPGTFVTNWNAYDAETRANVAQMNVHTYGTSGRLQVRDLANQADKPLWMSEIEGSWVSGWNPTSITNGIGLSGRVHDDLRELNPDAWVLWQPVEDLYNMEPQGENLNWGSVFIDLDCKPFDEAGGTVWKSERRVADAGGDSTQVEECGVQVNSKFNAMRNFTHFIEAGDSLIPTSSTTTTAAVAGDGDAVTLVHTNGGTADQTVTVDLSNFGTIAPGATATAYVTTEADSDEDPTGNALVAAEPVAVNAGAKSVTLTLPAKSISSVVIEGVSGVAEIAPGLVDGHTYQLQGVQSGLMLDSSTGRLRINTAASAAAGAPGQAWTAHAVETGARDDIHRVVLTDGQGRVMGATDADTDVRTMSVEDAAADLETRWIVSTLDGATFSLVNESLARTLEVGGQATAPGSTVGWWTSGGGAHQRWTLRDLTPVATELPLRTDVGVAPTLPATVAPQYAWGAGAAVPVTWEAPGANAWASEGRVEVQGAATDVFGTPFTVMASVDVGALSVADPRSVTTFAGASLAGVQAVAPDTIEAHVGASSQVFEVPVEWDWTGIDASSFAAVGSVTVPGTATVGGVSLDAVLTVLVTEPMLANINPASTTTASATSTESGYPVDRTRNGVQNDKGWSNWVSSNKPTQDTLTYSYGELRDIGSVAIYFYADGNTYSWAQSVAIQYRGEGGAWQTVPGLGAITLSNSTAAGAPVVDETFEPVRADAVRVVLTAFPNTHMVVSEVEVGALAASPADEAGLAALRVAGAGVEGFDPDTAAYTVTSVGSAYPTVSALAVDQAATVSIEQASADNGGVATVSVAAADGSATREYSVTIERQAAVSAVVTSAVAGSAAAASVTVDPDDAALAYEWLLDGEPVGTSETYVPAASAVGSELQVRVTATADGFLEGEALSEPVEVRSPVTLRDIASNPFKAEIEWLAATGVTTGWATSTPGVADFRPLSNVNRDQMAAFLYRLAGSPAFEAPAEPTFLDVPTDYVFYKEIEWLATTGVTTGWTVDEGVEFRPRIAVNRDVMAAFLYRYADSPDFDAPAVSPFVDVKTDHVFYKEIAWLNSTGISQGWDTKAGAQFRTTTPVKRDVMAAFLFRYADQFLED